MEPEEEFDDVDIDEAVAVAMEDLPRPVREFLASETRKEVARDLTKKYALRVDQAGEMEHALVLMLLGIMSPDEFVQSLSETGLERSTIQELAAEINSRIFIPLRLAQTGEQSFVPPEPTKPEPLSVPSVTYQTPEPPQQVAQTPAPVVHQPPQPSTQTPPPLHTTPPSAPEQFSAPTQPAHQPTPYGWQPAAAVHIYAPSYAAPYMPMSYQQPAQQPQAEPSMYQPTVPTFQAPPQPTTPLFQTAPQPSAPAFSPPPAVPPFIPPTPSFETPLQAPIPTTPTNPLAHEYPADPYREPV